MKLESMVLGAVLALSSLIGPAANAAERALSLAEAVELALVNDESILVRREALGAAEAAVHGARGAYDPLLTVEGGWREESPPVNSSFSGAPAGRLAPTAEVTGAAITLDQLLPTGATLSALAAADRAETDGVFGLLSPSYGTQAGVELRQPLLRNRAIDEARFRLRVAASDRAGAAAELARALADGVAAVEQAYWTLVATRREIEVREQAIRLAEEQLAETRLLIEAGITPELESAQPKAELERRRGELLAAREATTRAESALKRLILSDQEPESWSERLVPEAGPPPLVAPVDVEAAMVRALAARPELAFQQALAERRQSESALAKDALLPALDAVASYRRYGLAGDRNPAGSPAPGAGTGEVPPALEGGFGQSLELLRDGEFEDTRLALVLSLPLGNRRARADVAIAESAERQAAAELSSLRKAIRAEVLDAAAGLETAGQRIETARAAREAAEVQLDSEHQRYGAGISTNFLVLTRQNDLSRARLEEIAAQTDYRRAETELARVSGTLLSARDIVLDPPQDGGGGSDPDHKTRKETQR